MWPEVPCCTRTGEMETGLQPPGPEPRAGAGGARLSVSSSHSLLAERCGLARARPVAGLRAAGSPAAYRHHAQTEGGISQRAAGT